MKKIKGNKVRLKKSLTSIFFLQFLQMCSDNLHYYSTFFSLIIIYEDKYINLMI